MIAGDGWEVLHRDVQLGADPAWMPVAFFVPAAHAQGLVIVTLVLEDGRLVPSTGKLRHAD